MISESVASAGGAYPTELKCQVRLEDGSLAAIRPIRPDDAGALTNFHEHLSGETVYRRFFNAHPHLQAAELERFTHVDYRKRLALVAEIDGRFSAVARYDRGPDGDEAEVAFVVADALQGRGLGSLLLEHLAVAARRRGVSTFLAHTLASNYPMQNVFRHAGFSCTQRWADGAIEVSFPIAPTQHYLNAVLEREVHSVRSRLAGAPIAGSGGLGIACRTAATAELVESACRGAGLEVGMLLVTDDLAIDPYDALLYLTFDTDCEVVVVESARPVQLRRSVAAAREGVRRRPVVWLTPEGPDLAWCRQAGVDPVHRVEDLLVRVRALTFERRSGTWISPHRGVLIELSDCDVARARTALDQATGPSPGEPGSALRLPPGPTAEVLAAYGIAIDLGDLPGPRDEPYFVLEDEPDVGLIARLDSAPARDTAGFSVLLPLTDHDAKELVEAALLTCDNPDLAVEMVLRSARLIDDQPDVIQVRLPLHPLVSGDSPEVWTGRVRGTADDPFVRRLPSQPRGPQ